MPATKACSNSLYSFLVIHGRAVKATERSSHRAYNLQGRVSWFIDSSVFLDQESNTLHFLDGRICVKQDTFIFTS